MIRLFIIGIIIFLFLYYNVEPFVLSGEEIPENIKQKYVLFRKNKIKFDFIKEYLPNQTISNDTDCIYSYKTPKRDKYYSSNIQDLYDMYNTKDVYYNEINDIINVDNHSFIPTLYDEKKKIDISFCNTKNDLPNKCAVLSCNIDEDKHDSILRNIYFSQYHASKTEAKNKLINTRLNNHKKYKIDNLILNSYLDQGNNILN